MPTTFGREILGRNVVDQASDKLGVLADFRIDMSSGRITTILVALEEIAEVGVNIQLAR